MRVLSIAFRSFAGAGVRDYSCLPSSPAVLRSATTSAAFLYARRRTWLWRVLSGVRVGLIYDQAAEIANGLLGRSRVLEISFQPAIVVSRLDLMNYDITPSARVCERNFPPP